MLEPLSCRRISILCKIQGVNPAIPTHMNLQPVTVDLQVGVISLREQRGPTDRPEMLPDLQTRIRSFVEQIVEEDNAASDPGWMWSSQSELHAYAVICRGADGAWRLPASIV